VNYKYRISNLAVLAWLHITSHILRCILMGTRDGKIKQDMTGLMKVWFSVLVDMSVDQRPTLIWTGNIYDIYQQEVPEMDMSSHLMR